jgi:hypothetical protein
MELRNEICNETPVNQIYQTVESTKKSGAGEGMHYGKNGNKEGAGLLGLCRHNGIRSFHDAGRASGSDGRQDLQ